jgi:diaminohydroxyphosphoribosylaminopyrimidine deaminase/5-amino-6-(5-phosphoribosylamino)uracil reductase
VAEPADPAADRRWLIEAIELSRRCPPSVTAFSVGAIIVGADGNLLSTGYSREVQPADHAEEVALARLGLPRSAGQQWPPGPGQPGAAGRRPPDLSGATMYSSLEPCAARTSRPVPCADLIVASGIGRVVIAWREPPLFVAGGGAIRLSKAGVVVVVMPELEAAARAVNAHLSAD